MRIFDLFKSDENIYPPVRGKCIDIEECSDITFSKKIMGDGFIIEPYERTICAPCDGKLTMIFPTMHAFGVKMNNGHEILVHIGINSVNLAGEGFKQLVEQGRKVKKGTPIIEVDFDLLTEEKIDNSVITIVIGNKEVKKNHLGEFVEKSSVIVEG